MSVFSTLQFIIYFLANVKKILPIFAYRIIKQLTYFFSGQMPPRTFLQIAQLQITDCFPHKSGYSMADSFKTSPDDSIFPLFQSKL
jgi:hypothetical protein